MRESLFAFVFLSGSLTALPQNGVPVQGDAEFRLSPQTLEIITSDRSILEWSDFSIGENETTRFLQPNERAAVLNRVVDPIHSQLLGRLESNGLVLLINPSGIFIGAEGRIDTASFIASSFDIHNDAFRNSKWAFDRLSHGEIVNRGKVRASNGDLLLLGAHVSNEGHLEAAKGFVALVAGCETATGLDGLSTYGSTLFTHPETKHSGSIQSPEVYLLGKQVLLANGSTIDASSDFGGGTVLIGGDYQGKNLRIANAKMSWVEAGTVIDASAKINGPGGKIIVWGDEGTGFYGRAFADGGPLGGDGGFVEVSGKTLQFDGVVSRLAPKGRAGTLLLDPCVVTISAAPDAGFAVPYTFTGVAATVNNITLATNLNLGNVVIDAANLGTGAASSITVLAPVGTLAPVWNSANSLTLRSGGNIAIRSDIMCTESAVGMPTGDIILIAPSNSLISIGTGGGVAVGVGSQNGNTIIGDPALPRCERSRPNVNIGGFGPTSFGYYFKPPLFPAASNTGTARGPIDVTCRDLNVLANPFTLFCGAQLGHGAPSPTGGTTLNLTTTAAATITVDSSGNVTLIGGANNSEAQIGHGGTDIAFTPSTFADLDGAISVTATGDVTLRQDVNLVFLVERVQIGHGCSRDVAVSVVDLNGDITVRGNNVRFLANNPAGAATASLQIGHTSALAWDTANGDVMVFANGNIEMLAPAGFDHLLIGHQRLNGAAGAMSTSNVFVSANGDFTILAGTTGTVHVGTSAGAMTDGITEVLVRNNFGITSTNGIGAIVAIGTTSPIQPTAVTNVAVGRNFTLNASVGQPIHVRGPSDVNVSVLGNLTATGSSVAAFLSFISPTFTGFNTRVLAGGSIIAAAGTNASTPSSYFLIGRTTAPALLPAAAPAVYGDSLVLKAGGALQILNGCNTATGSIEIGSGQRFQPGELWTMNGITLATIATDAHPAMGPPAAFCAPIPHASPLAIAPVTTCVASVIPLAAQSPAAGGGCTCIDMNSAFNANCAILRAPIGAIAVLGNGINAIPCNQCAPCAAVGSPLLLIGPQAGPIPGSTNTFQIVVPTTGDILISQFGGCLLNQDLTANNITVNTCGDFTLSAGNDLLATGIVQIASLTGSITTVAGSTITSPGPIFLTANWSNLGVGNLSVDSAITSGGGDVILNAGPGTFGCTVGSNCLLPYTDSGTCFDNCQTGGIAGFPATTSSVSLGSNAVLTVGGGDVNVIAADGISIDTPIMTSGVIAITAGAGDLTITQPIVSTMSSITTYARGNTTLNGAGNLVDAFGEIRMMTGESMTLMNGANIVSSSGSVTLVVDNNFPAPINGNAPPSTNGFFLNAGSSVTGTPLKIFTNRQDLNSIQGLLNGLSFTPGTLFQDTAQEIWCTYCDCPSPYFFGSGLPFTVFYKDCLQQVTVQAQRIVTEVLLDLHPYNEFPGWEEEFTVDYRPTTRSMNKKVTSLDVLPKEKFLLRRRHLNIINYPKTWTILLPE